MIDLDPFIIGFLDGLSIFLESGVRLRYLTRNLRRDSLKEVGIQYDTNKYGCVSSIVERIKVFGGENGHIRRIG